MKNNLIEEINRAKTIWGYNTRLTLNEQPNYDPATGTGPNPTCPDSTPGSFMGGAGFTGNFIDPNDPICQGIFNQAGYNPSINQYQQCCEVSTGGGSCDAPTSLNVTNITTTSATLNWGPVTDATSYEVVSSEQGVPAWVNLPSVTSPTIDNTGLMTSTTYEFAVRSVCSTGTSDWSVGGSGYQESGITPELYDTAQPTNQGSDPFYCVGGVAGMSCIQASTPPGGTTSGGPFNTMADCQNSGCGGTQTGSCNKTCQEMAPGFKKKAGVRNCNWLTNKLPVLINKLATKTPGTCAHKRITCKIGVLEYLIESKGC